MKCPRCRAEADGAFCSHCGTDLTAGATCRRCGNALTPGARYCIRCGARAGGGATLRWMLPVAVAVIALAAGYWLGDRDGTDAVRSDAPELAMTRTASGSDGAMGSPPPLTGTLRDQADRLFERIMQARARGDTAEARFFLPMALQAYQGVEDLDVDGLFHLGLLQLTGGLTADARQTAERIAARDEGHLFGIGLAADAALQAGDADSARTLFERFLARYDDEIARDLPEYELHAPALDEFHERAEQMTAG